MSIPPYPDVAGFPEFPLEEHLLKLGTSEDSPDFSVLLCTARYEEVAPKLLALLDRAAAGETLDDDERRMFFRGLHIIGGCRDPLAFKPLLRFLRRPPEDVDALLGDALAETLAQIWAGVFDGDVAALLDAIVDLSIDEAVRRSLLGAATFLAWEGRIPRQQFVDFLGRFRTELLAPEDDMAWLAWADAVTLLGLRDMWPALVAAVETDLLVLDAWDLKLFEQELESAEQEPRNIERFKDAALGYIDDVVVSLQRFNSFGGGGGGDDDFDIDGDDDLPPLVLRRTPANVPAVNPWRGVGRNDPCPCGSGKKAKRCCLAA